MWQCGFEPDCLQSQLCLSSEGVCEQERVAQGQAASAPASPWSSHAAGSNQHRVVATPSPAGICGVVPVVTGGRETGAVGGLSHLAVPVPYPLLPEGPLSVFSLERWSLPSRVVAGCGESWDEGTGTPAGVRSGVRNLWLLELDPGNPAVGL